MTEWQLPNPWSFILNAWAKALEATVSESGRQLHTPKVSAIEFPPSWRFRITGSSSGTAFHRQGVSFKHPWKSAKFGGLQSSIILFL